MSIKKAVAVAGLVAALGLGTQAFAQLQMSSGIQAAVRSNFGGGVKGDISQGGYWVKDEIGSGYFGFGFNSFLDLTYVEVSVGLTTGSIDWEYKVSTSDGINFSNKITGNFTSLDLAIFGKYPIDLGNMVVFPTVGVEYQLMSSIEVPAELIELNSDATDYGRMWVKFGAGLDFPISDKMYFRGTALYGIGLASKFEDDFVKLAKDMYAGVQSVSVDPIMSHGIDIRAGIGYKF